MKGEMLDTSAEGRRLYYAHLARLTPTEKLAIMDKTSQMVRRLAEAGIRREHPGLSDGELRLRLAVRLYGPECVEKILGPLPADRL